MNEFDEIRDDQIRVVGETESRGKKCNKGYIAAILLAVIGVIALVVIVVAIVKHRESIQFEPEPALFEPQVETVLPVIEDKKWFGAEVNPMGDGFTEIKDTTLNDIALRIYIPHNAEMSLHLGKLDRSDTSIIYAAQAADVRADNGGIVGAFVLKGEQMSRGLAKRGYCAVIDGKVSIGVAENTPLFEETTAKGGYFFRQYPLVDSGQLILNEPKGKSVRRGICDRKGEIFMVETLTQESFYDFAQVLVDLGIDQAIYLVGSSAYGWAVGESGIVHEFGEQNNYQGRHRMPKNISYIVWRKK